MTATQTTTATPTRTARWRKDRDGDGQWWSHSYPEAGHPMSLCRTDDPANWNTRITDDTPVRVHYGPLVTDSTWGEVKRQQPRDIHPAMRYEDVPAQPAPQPAAATPAEPAAPTAPTVQDFTRILDDVRQAARDGDGDWEVDALWAAVDTARQLLAPDYLLTGAPLLAEDYVSPNRRDDEDEDWTAARERLDDAIANQPDANPLADTGFDGRCDWPAADAEGRTPAVTLDRCPNPTAFRVYTHDPLHSWGITPAWVEVCTEHYPHVTRVQMVEPV